MIPTDVYKPTILLKTVDRISLQRMAVIMTIKTYFSEDISRNNEVYNFPPDISFDFRNVYGVSWTEEGDPQLENIFKKIDTIFKVIAGENICLILISQESWQDNNRIVRYKKLTGYLSEKGILLSREIIFRQWEIFSNHLVKHLGIINVLDINKEDFRKIFIREKQAYLLFCLKKKILLMTWKNIRKITLLTS